MRRMVGSERLSSTKADPISRRHKSSKAIDGLYKFAPERIAVHKTAILFLKSERSMSHRVVGVAKERNVALAFRDRQTAHVQIELIVRNNEYAIEFTGDV